MAEMWQLLVIPPVTLLLSSCRCATHVDCSWRAADWPPASRRQLVPSAVLCLLLLKVWTSTHRFSCHACRVSFSGSALVPSRQEEQRAHGCSPELLLLELPQSAASPQGLPCPGPAAGPGPQAARLLPAALQGAAAVARPRP